MSKRILDNPVFVLKIVLNENHPFSGTESVSNFVKRLFGLENFNFF